MPPGLSSHLEMPCALVFPHPAAECVTRLAAVTAKRGYVWYLDSGNACRTAPLLRGRVTGLHVTVARFEATLGRNSFVAWLNADLVGCPGGTTVLSGTVGLSAAVSSVLFCTLCVGVIVLGACVALLVRLLLSGRLLSAIPLTVISALLVATPWLITRSGLRSMRSEGPRLVSIITDLLT